MIKPSTRQLVCWILAVIINGMPSQFHSTILLHIKGGTGRHGRGYLQWNTCMLQANTLLQLHVL